MKTSLMSFREEVYSAHLSEPITAIDDTQLFDKIVIHLQTTAQISTFHNTFAGGKMSKEEKQFMLENTAVDIVEGLRHFHPGMKMDELENIFRFGRMGKLGESVGLTPATVMGWADYYYTKVRVPMMKDARFKKFLEEQDAENRKKLHEQDQKARQMEWDEKLREEIIRLYWASIAAKEYQFKSDNAKQAYYSFLERKGAIVVSNEEKKKIFERTKKKYVEDQKYAGNRDKELINFENALDNIGNHKSAVKRLSRVFLFDKIMMEWISSEINIEEKIKNT